jgi:hypothetical protein
MARWNSFNILHVAPDAKRLWQFDAKGGGFVLGREQRVPHAQPLPGKSVAKSWTSLWQPKLNIAWLPPENVFLRVVELPASSAEEMFAMAELQLEKISPLPVAQIVWTMHVLPAPKTAPAEGAVALQTVVMVLVERAAVETFLGQLEAQNFLADRLEVPLLDQLAAVDATEDAAWVFPLHASGQNTALVAWWFGGALRSLSLVTLPKAGERAADLKTQLSLLAWAGELEGWLTGQPKWHLVADPVTAAEWETALRVGLDEPVQVSAPLSPVELAGRTAKRAATTVAPANLLPAEFTSRYHQQFVDRLWLRGLAAAGVCYAVLVLIYFCAVAVLGYRTHGVEKQVAALGGSYTNALQLKARYEVLNERSQLKYAALDCWQLVAQELPAPISLQRFSFADGKKVALSGVCTPEQISLISDPNKFYDNVRKARQNGQPMFDQNPDDQLVYRQQGTSQATWNFAVELRHAEAEPQ